MKCIICNKSKSKKDMYKIPQEIYELKRKFPCCSKKCWIKYLDNWKKGKYF